MHHAPLKKNRKNVNWKRTAVTVLVASGVFLLGWGIGSNRIAVGPNAAFHKSVSKNAPSKLDYSSIDDIYNNLKQNYDGDLDTKKLYDGLKEGLAKATGDPYTEYFNPKAAKEFDDSLSGTFTGIGAELSKDANDNIIVVAPISGFPAEKAGIKPKDIIVEVDGKSMTDASVSEAVSRIRGPKGTSVKLKVVRNGKEVEQTIVRDQITMPSVEWKIVDGNIGYIKVSRFGEDTAQLASQAAQEFKQKNVSGVVLDLRSDPGGYLDAAVKVSSLWLTPGKKILDEKRGGVVVKSYKADGEAVLAGVPTVVLINEGSASASEITAGALHDNKAATLVGVKSFGKGSVQQPIKLQDGSILKVTVARWYTPAGKNINKEGIEPDKKIERTEDDFKNNRDPQLDAAVIQLRK